MVASGLQDWPKGWGQVAARPGRPGLRGNGRCDVSKLSWCLGFDEMALKDGIFWRQDGTIVGLDETPTFDVIKPLFQQHAKEQKDQTAEEVEEESNKLIGDDELRANSHLVVSAICGTAPTVGPTVPSATV